MPMPNTQHARKRLKRTQRVSLHVERRRGKKEEGKIKVINGGIGEKCDNTNDGRAARTESTAARYNKVDAGWEIQKM